MHKTALLLLPLLLLPGTSALAQEGEVYGTFGAAKIEDFDVGYDLGGGVSALWGRGIRVGINFEGQVLNSSDELLGIDADLDIRIFTLNLVIEGDGPVRPYFIIGAGYANSDVSVDVADVTVTSDDQDDFVGNVGGGIKFLVGRHFFFGPDFRYFRIEETNIPRGALILGVKF
jgi:hypothetical protein